MGGARALSWAGRDLWPSQCFGFAPVPMKPLGEGGAWGPPSCPQLEGLERREAMSSAPGCVCGGERIRGFSKLVELPSASCCGALSTHCGVVSLVTHSPQTSPWKLSG